MQQADEQIAYQYEFTVTPDYRRALSAALFRASFRGPYWAVIAGLLLVGGAFSLLESSWIPLVVMVVVEAALVPLFFVGARRRVGIQFPVGKLLRSGFGDNAFRVGSDEASSTISFGLVGQIETGPQIVWMRGAQRRGRSGYPRVLFPDAELDRIRAAIAARTDAPTS